jgi:EAL domain-containing protein (putative c-di-GMP-specific phosphodiesterase class I)/GGDEF domain-containing protein
MGTMPPTKPIRQKAISLHGDGAGGGRALAQKLVANGWKVEPNAPIALIDARGGIAAALAALSTAAKPATARIVIYPQSMADSLPAMLAAGATHLLRAPFHDAELLAILALAEGQMDTSRRKERQPQPRRAYRDGLTGLLTERALSQRLSAFLPKPVTLLLISIARFDMVNTAYGSDMADGVLRSLARRVEALANEIEGAEPLVARMPGAQFAVALLGPVTLPRLQLLAEAILDGIEQPFASEGEVIHLGGRLAVVAGSTEDRAASSIFRRANALLAEGRSDDEEAIRFSASPEGVAAIQIRSLHADLRAALAKDEIEILFQPQIGIASGLIEGVEALARWTHPELGPVGAATLFSVAQQSDYLKALSAHCQARALNLAGQWPNELSQLRLAVNVVAADIARPRFLREFLEMVDTSGFPRERLTVEITETGAMADLDRSARILGQLRAVGIRVAIDDFGTGYSSLAWLKALPADYLKLDKGLTGEIGGSARDAVVVRGVIGMARSLGLSVIAEGVESEGQLALLAREGCTLFQGFLHSRAMASDDLVKMINASTRRGSQPL